MTFLMLVSHLSPMAEAHSQSVRSVPTHLGLGSRGRGVKLLTSPSLGGRLTCLSTSRFQGDPTGSQKVATLFLRETNRIRTCRVSFQSL